MGVYACKWAGPATLTALAAAVMSSACSSAPAPAAVTEETLGEAVDPIIGGVVDTGDPAVAQMRVRYGNSVGSCSATLITPTVVLTAGHCVEDATASTPVEVYFGTYASQAPASEWRRVRTVKSHPEYPHRYINEGHDCALLFLEQPVSGIAPVPFNTQPLDSSWLGKPARIVGFGHTDGYRQSGGGTKRNLDTSIKEVQSRVVSIGQRGATSCQGDSGGPMLATVGGVEKVIGVSSYGQQYCIGLGTYSRTDACAAWISQEIGACSPSCAGRACGSDGCGGTCGSCAGADICDAAGQCVAGSNGGGSNGGGSNGGGSNGGGSNGGGSNGGDCVEREGNDSFSGATRLFELCPGGTVSGSLATATDEDDYTFDVPAGATYDIAIDAPRSANFALYKDTGTSYHHIGPGEGTGTRRTLTRTTPDGGKYILMVYRYMSGSAPGESYTLSVAITR
ncbi:MAG: trypsin-like serine protease [Polyangiaceae bacterium]